MATRVTMAAERGRKASSGLVVLLPSRPLHAGCDAGPEPFSHCTNYSFLDSSSSEPTDGTLSCSRDRTKKIAIVEDEQDLIQIYSFYFESIGYGSILAFTTGEDFLRAISEGGDVPDTVMMDYRLPGKDGLETAKQVLALNPDTKVIITTADDAIREKARDMGFMFLQKPFSMKELRSMMDRN